MNLPPPLPVFLSVVSNASLLKRLLLPFVVICAALLIGACSQAVKSAEPDPDPEPTPKVQPTLLGTWQRVSIEQDDDGNEITQTTLLTFTATHYFDRTVVSESGVRFDDWDNAGTYTTTTATSMEKTFYIDDDDDGIAEESSVEKEFLFTGDSLLIHHWGSEHREQSYERFERLEGLPTTGATTLQGTWRRAGYWDDDEHGPSREIFVLTLTRTRFIESFVNGDSATDDIRDDVASSRWLECDRGRHHHEDVYYRRWRSRLC